MASEIKVTNIKANDGTASLTIADSTGAITEVKTGTIKAADGTAGMTIANSTGAITASNNLTVSGDLVPSTPLSHRNMIINGAMNVAQRGTSSTSGGYQTVDRFQSGGGTIATTQSQESLSSSDTGPWEAGFKKAFKALTTNATTSTAAYYSLQTILEAQDLATSGWNYTSTSSYITLSFWALSNDAGAYTCSVRSQDGTSYYYDTTYTLVAGTWKKVEITIPGKSDLQFDNNNLHGIRIFPFIAYGTDFTASGSAGSWQTYNGAGGDETIPNTDATAWMNNSGSYIMITGVQLELGSNATPFEHRSYGDELARCQRYFYMLADGSVGSVSSSTGQSTPIGLGQMYNSTVIYMVLTWPVAMRTEPTIYEVGGAGYFKAYTNGTGFVFNAGWSVRKMSPTAGNILSTTATGTGGHAIWVELDSQSARLGFIAEL